MIGPKEILALCASVTPGPWEWVEDTWHGGHSGIVGANNTEVLFPNHCNEGDGGAAWFDELPSDADKDFIALARTALPELAQRVIALEEENTKLRAVAEGGKISLRHCLPDPDEDEGFVTCDGYPDACHQCSAGKLREALIAAGYGGETCENQTSSRL